MRPVSEAAVAALRAAPSVWIDGLGEARLLDLAPHGKGWLARIDRIRHVDAAKAHRHAAVRVDPARLPEEARRALAPVAVGLPVVVDGRPFGTVTAESPPGANPLLYVDGPDGERLLPLNAPYVRVDDDAVRVTAPPPGLLEDES